MPYSRGGLDDPIEQTTDIVIECLIRENRHRKRVAKITAIERQYLS